jgi:hypothetical protein
MTEAKLYAALYHLVYATAHVARRARELYDDRWVVLVHLWGVIHDRSQSWSCDPANWPDALDRPLVSQSRLSRRLRTVGVLQLLERLQAAACDLLDAAARGGPPLVKAIDSKPLTVGAYSKDPDAKKPGRVANGQFAKGYRLHAVTHGRGAVRHWTLRPIADHDALGGADLLPRLAGDGGGGYVLADNAYDSNQLYALAAAAGHQLVAPARAANRDVRDARHNCAERLRALDMLHGPLEKCGVASTFGQRLYDGRQRVESTFGGLAMAGLGALPAFVRTPHRVAAWAAGKLLAFTVSVAVKQGLMA